MDRRRRRWFALSALYPHGETAGRIQAEFGRDGLLVWILFLSACKRSHIPGSFSYTSEEAAWIELGLADPTDRPAFSLDEFWTFMGRLKQTSRTRVGRVTNVTATRWKDWQDSSRRQLEAEKKSRKRTENTGDNGDPDRDSDRDQDPDKDKAAADQDQDLDLEEGGESAAAGSPEDLESIRESELRPLVGAMVGADRRTFDVVEPLALAVPRSVFLATLERVNDRHAKNPVGLLVRLLQIAAAEQARLAAAAMPAPGRDFEVIELRPRPAVAIETVQAMARQDGRPWDDVHDEITRYFHDIAEADLERAYVDALDGAQEPAAAGTA